ncbi:MAG: sulfatase [Hyphomonadaceae bacterium]|nr:MAG: sulfatase [Hyphomonadaceae bacterium]
MKKSAWIIIGVVAIALVFLGFQKYKIYIPGIIANIKNPIAENHEVVWQQASDAPLAKSRPPNIILIVVDDLGMNDISLFGGGVGGGLVPTPNINSIANEGVSFTNGYAANATCSPSRAAIMTGRYPTRFGFEFTAVPSAFARTVGHANTKSPYPIIFHEELDKDMMPYEQMGVPASEITIAELLKTRDYRTIHLGKWHLGEAAEISAHGQGFDESLGFSAGASKFMRENDANVVNAKLPWDPIDRFLWPNLPYAVQFNGGQRFEPKGHMTDYLTDNALAAIEANKARPFFMYLAYNAVHTPLQATKADYDALPQITDHTERVYGAMVRQLDRRIGDILQKLKDSGIDDNTLVIFTSDNGGAWYAGLPNLNRPYRGWKATFFEGGIRVPLLMRWKGKIAPNSTNANLAGHLDLFETIATAAGASSPKDRIIDSRNLLGNGPPRQVFFWRSGGYRAVREGDWKLQIADRPNQDWLYNLRDDPTEKNNLAASNPEKVAQLRALIVAQNANMANPQWPGLIEAPVRIDVPLNTPWDKNQEYVYWTN